MTGGSGRGGHPWAPLGTLGQGGGGKKLRYWDGVCLCAQTQHQLLRIASYVYTIIFFCILTVCLFVVWVGLWVLQDAFIFVHLRVFDKYLRRWSRLASGSPLCVARQPDMLTWPPAASPSAKYETIWKYSIFNILCSKTRQKKLAWQNRNRWLGRKEMDSLAENNWRA